MFKGRNASKEPQKATPAEAPQKEVKTAQQLEVERTIARADRFKKLGEEAGMWRAFATGCGRGRHLMEYGALYGFSEPALMVTMDDDTALLWKEFALRMAADRERRLQDMLSAA